MKHFSRLGLIAASAIFFLLSCTKLGADSDKDTITFGSDVYRVSRFSKTGHAIFLYAATGIKDATVVYHFGGSDSTALTNGIYKVVAKASAANEVDVYALLTSTSVVKYFSTGGNVSLNLTINNDAPGIQMPAIPVQNDDSTSATTMSAAISHL